MQIKWIEDPDIDITSANGMDKVNRTEDVITETLGMDRMNRANKADRAENLDMSITVVDRDDKV